MYDKILDDYLIDPLNIAKAEQYILHHSLHDAICVKDKIVSNEYLFYPEWNIQLKPQIEQLTEQSAVVNYYLSAPDWGIDLFECSVALGEDTVKAVNLSSASFLFSFMDGLKKVKSGKNYDDTLKTQFAGNAHKWKVYISDIVSLGDKNKVNNPAIYWNKLKDEIAKRLGNQKLYYIKVYAAKSYGDVIGECRINNVKSNELSKLVAEIAAEWETDTFSSNKVFFFVEQDKETVLPYPYYNENKVKIKDAVYKAMKFFLTCINNNEDYETVNINLHNSIEDNVLASECYCFIPEICVENAFENAVFKETISIIQEENITSVYKIQLADYYAIYEYVFDIFSSDYFSKDEIDKIYTGYISISASGNVINKMLEQEGKLKFEEIASISIRYEVDYDFKIR